MPKSLPRRVEHLERREGRPAARTGPLFLIETCEQIARSDPSDRPVGFDAAWEPYVVARDGVPGTEPPPPDHYRPEMSEPVRTRLWRKWDHPAVRREVDALLEWLIHQKPDPKPRKVRRPRRASDGRESPAEPPTPA